jgi:hypothetical protein
MVKGHGRPLRRLVAYETLATVCKAHSVDSVHGQHILVGVGIMISHNPLHGSGQAELPHPALTSGNNAHAAQGIRMTSTGGRQPAVDQAPHPGPEHVGVLAAPRKGAMPEPADLEPKRMQRHAVGRHAVIADVSTYDRAQPPADFRNGVMHAPFELDLDLAQLRLQPFANRLSQHREPSIAPLLPADMRKAEEIERLRFPVSALLPVSGRGRPEFQQSRFLGMQFQAKLSHSLDQFRPEPYGIRLHLKAHHDVVSKPHDDHVTAGLFLTPRLGPQVEHVVQIDVGQQRRCHAPYTKGNFGRRATAGHRFGADPRGSGCCDEWYQAIAPVNE